MKVEIRKERTHLFAPNINIALMVEFCGKVQESTLRSAIQEAVDHNEVLGCKITIDENGNAFYETNKPKAIFLEAFLGEWKDKVIEQESIAFEIKEGELIRFFVKENENSTQLLIIAHHLVGDGLSITSFVDDVLNVLNGKNIEFKKQKIFDMKLVPADSKLNLFMRIMLSKLNKKWNNTGKVFSYSDYEDMFKEYWSTNKTDIITSTLDEIQLAKIEREAKRHKVSINSVLATELIKIAGEVVELGIPVSLREKGNRSMANYSTAVSIKEKYDNNKTFWENVINTHNAIYAKLGDNKRKFFLIRFMDSISPTLIDAAYFTAFNGYENKVAKSISDMFGYTKTPAAINLSNLTRITKTKETEEHSIRDMYFVPPIVPNSACMLGVVTYNNKLNITFHALANELFPKKKEYFDQVMNDLCDIELTK